MIGTAAYAIAVRTSEFDLPPDMLDDLVAQMVSRATDTSGFGDDTRRRRGAEYEEVEVY